MFWKSVWDGFSIFLNWKVWIFIIFYGSIMFNFHTLFLKHLLKSFKKETPPDTTKFIIFKALLEAVIVTFSTVFLIPLLFGHNILTDFDLIKVLLWDIVKIALMITIVKLIVSALGSFNKALTENGDGGAFFMSVAAIIVITHNVLSSIPETLNIETNVYPSFWLCLGFFGISLPMLLIFLTLLGAVSKIFNDSTKKVIEAIIKPSLNFMMGIAFMSMYCAYIKNMLERVV